MALPEFLQQWQALPQPPELYLYAIVDSAQDARLLDRLHKITPRAQSQCLLADAQGPELSKAAPHLVILPPVAEDAEAWLLLFRSAASNPASLTIIASPQEFAPLHAHLVQFTEVVLPDGDEMYFAFWDPAVLGTLVGQKDDHTLHVPGPVLSARQCSKLLTKINAWWYWDRDGNLHQVREDVPQPDTDQVRLPLKPTQVQLDMLIEASVPDHLLGYIKETQPELLIDIPEGERYMRVEHYLLEARKLNLRGMQDITRYICAGLIYGSQLQQNSVIEELLEKVKVGQISLPEALEQFP
ncbi:uncharacterized protein DUF4123 [Collimonas sp. PA-H2]|uniref:DUF4123 domain-containing protein n=1 Tax=Collimonas sp. PA-H2 TaxID=1881062 RepID=UPI000C010B02|nr:DUF4123 domain-containing protein [Collimonas sp. PA-H2]PFH10926.1 uncharacterized protein DUF4123 [Collimonas sp. PA-H2]